jgi:hypothetical protein
MDEGENKDNEKKEFFQVEKIVDSKKIKKKKGTYVS